MWCRVACLFVLAACGTDERFPLRPPTADAGPRPDGPPIDAPPDPPPVTITGSICLLTDLRDLGSCDAAGLGTLDVALGAITTTSAAGTGVFSIELDPAATHWRVGNAGSGARISRMQLDPTKVSGVSIPILSNTLYDALLAANGLVETAEQGAAVIVHRRAGNPLAGVVLRVVDDTDPPPPPPPVRYDGADALDWEETATGPRGVGWVTGLAPGTVGIKSDISVGTDVEYDLVIEAGAITFHVVNDI
jgi:hypothetical protein